MSASNKLKHAAVCFAVAVLCLIFSIIYNVFSHGVHSPYMTYLFAFPLVLGTVPNIITAVINYFCTKHGTDRRTDVTACEDAPVAPLVTISSNLYYSGVAALTASSMLRGIFDIAGTASVYQTYLWDAGIIMIAAGLIAGVVQFFISR